MIKHIFCVGLPLFSITTWAAGRCPSYLSVSEFPGKPISVSAPEQSAAKEWISSMTLLGPSPVGFDVFLRENDQKVEYFSDGQLEVWKARYAASLWRQWSQVTEAQRDANLALELSKLSPPTDNGPFQLQADQEFQVLSRINKERLLKQLQTRFPIHPSAAQVRQVEDLVKTLTLHFFRPLASKFDPGSYATLVSARESRRFGWIQNTNWFEKLIGEPTTIEFNTVASKGLDRTLAFGHSEAVYKTELQAKLAADHGLMIPHFNSALELIQHFRRWEPEALEDLLRYMRFALPEDIRTVQDLAVYATPKRLEQLFPEESSYYVLSTLRTRLYRYVMTTDDGTEFLKAALTHYLLRKAVMSPLEFGDLVTQYARTGGAQALFSSELLPFLGWSGIDVRVPVSVSAGRYSHVRVEGVPNPLRLGLSQDPYDSRRLDHSLMR